MHKPAEPRLLRAIEEIGLNEEGSRPWALASLYLTYCQRCQYFTGATCGQVPDQDLAVLLCSQAWECRRWGVIHPQRNDLD
jgi:hypothetical protein